MEAIFLESLFVEQIGGGQNHSKAEPPPAALVLQYSYNTYNIFLQQYFLNIFTMWRKSHTSSISRPRPALFCRRVKRRYSQLSILPCTATLTFKLPCIATLTFNLHLSSTLKKTASEMYVALYVLIKLHLMCFEVISG